MEKWQIWAELENFTIEKKGGEDGGAAGDAASVPGLAPAGEGLVLVAVEFDIMIEGGVKDKVATGGRIRRI